MNKTPEQIIASISQFRKSNFIILLIILLANSSCTFFRVGKMLKYDFAPAFKKGDPKQISHYSTKRFSKVLNKFSQNELKSILNFGQDSDSSGKTKSDDFSYESFSHKGKRAVFKVESNGSTIRFICKNEKGDWKVDDILIKNLDNTFSLRDILGIFHTIKQVLDKLKQNSIPQLWLSPKLARTSKILLPYFVHLLKDFQLFPKKKKKEKKKKKKKKDEFIKSFKLATTKKGGNIQIESKIGKFRVDLQRKIDFWKIKTIALKLSDNPLISLNSLGKYFKSILQTGSYFLFKNNRPDPQKKLQLFLQLFSPKFKKSFQKTTPLLRNFLASFSFAQFKEFLSSSQSKSLQNHTETSAKKPDNTWQQYLKSFHFRFSGNNLLFLVNSKKLNFKIKLNPQGKIADIVLKFSNNKIELDDLISFIPWYSVLKEFAKTPKTPVQRRAKLDSVLALVQNKHLKNIKNALPDTIETKWWKFFQAIWADPDNKTSSKDGKTKNLAGLDLNLESVKDLIRDFHFTSAQNRRYLRIKLQINKNFLHIEFSRNSYKWQLSSVKIPGTGNGELLKLITLLPFVLNLSEGLLQTDSQLFLNAFSSSFATNLKYSWKFLFNLHGKKLKKLLSEVQNLLLKRLTSKAINSNGKNQSSQKKVFPFSFPKLQQKGKVLSLDFGKNKLFFRKNTNQNWGLAYSDSNKINKKNPLQFIELVPMFISYYYGLRSFNKRYLRKYSSYKFNGNIWNKISKKQLRSAFDKFNLEIPALTAETIVNTLLPDKSTDQAIAGSENSFDLRNFHFYRYRRWPFAEIMLTASGRKLDLQYGWHKKQNRWVLWDIKVEQSFLGKISLVKNLPLLLKKK